MSPWLIGTAVYATAAVLTALPIAVALFRGVKLHPGGSSFEDSPFFSEEARKRLVQHYSRMQGTLAFWKTQAEIYKHSHYYMLCWTIPSSLIIPFLAQAVSDDPWSKWMVTIVSAFTALLLAFHKAFKVDANYKAFRQGESDFYDTYRRMLDRPDTFGRTERKQLDTYFDTVENLRKIVRNAEIDNMPTLDQAKMQLSHERGLPPETSHERDEQRKEGS